MLQWDKAYKLIFRQSKQEFLEANAQRSHQKRRNYLFNPQYWKGIVPDVHLPKTDFVMMIIIYLYLYSFVEGRKL